MNKIKKYIAALAFAAIFVFSAGAASKSWKAVATEMKGILDDACAAYESGNADAAYERVNDAYFGHYEVDGFERNTQSRIGGSRAGNVEVQFSRVKGAIRNGNDKSEVRAEADTLIAMLFEDAEKLDPPQMSWNELSKFLNAEFEEAAAMYEEGKVVTAEPKFRKAYARYYGKSRLQENVVKSLSAKKDQEIVDLYTKTKKMILSRADKAQTSQSIKNLGLLIEENALSLTKAQGRLQWWGTVFASLMILLREGFEAILIVGAIIAYLRKINQNNQREAKENGVPAQEVSLKPVFNGSMFGILASIVMAIILITITRFGFASGQGQEVVEGVTMFIAVVVLFYTSNWMISKSSEASWSTFIKGKVQTSVDKSSMFGLAFTCFLAVFREGAEVILFYQAMFASSDGSGVVGAVLLGIAISVVLLIFVYKAIIVAGKRLPLKPFFLATSILMFIMVVSFVGGGISEFVDAGWIIPHVIEGFPTISILGIFPYKESLGAQAIALVVVVASLTIGLAISKNKAKKAA
ncbi:MAG: FTR1 family iron permease [Treponema sp.]|nr:FTR1 family iron permease [Treponema sp.]